jgi:hypothetical protein
MTIGIGAVCSVDQQVDCLVLVCDRLGSFGGSFSNKMYGKMFCIGEERVFAVCADIVEHASQLLPLVVELWKHIPERKLNFLEGALTEAVIQYKSYRFYLDVLPQYGISPRDDWRLVAGQMGIFPQVLEQWQNFNIQCDLILGTFDDSNHAHMYLIQGDCTVTPITTQGYCAIGSGALAAMFWLSYRQQNFGMGVRRSAYHMYEAKLMSEQSPYVGKDDLDMLIIPASHQKWYLLNKDQQEVEGCPVSFSRLKELLGEFGPQSTDALEIIP